MISRLALIAALAAGSYSISLPGTATAQQTLQPEVSQLSETDIPPLPHEGYWRTDNQKSEMEVYQCLQGTWCARIVWLLEPLNEQGQPKVDFRNPSDAQRNRLLMGMDIMTQLVPDAENPVVLKGQVYNPRNGKSYLVFLEPSGGALKVTGCLFWPACKSENWTRILEPSPLVDNVPAAGTKSGRENQEK